MNSSCGDPSESDPTSLLQLICPMFTRAILCSVIISLATIGAGCATNRSHVQSEPFQNTNNAISLIVFAEDPIQTMEPAAQCLPEVTFYDWVRDAFSTYAGNNVNLFSDKFVSDVTDQYHVEHTIANAPVPHSNGKTRIHHLAFAEDKMSWLCDFGAKAGATHIIKLRYIFREVTVQHIRMESHNNYYHLININGTYEGDANVLKIIASYQIYNTQKRRIIDSGIFDSSNDSEAKIPSVLFGNQNATIKRRLVETILARIHSSAYSNHSG